MNTIDSLKNPFSSHLSLKSCGYQGKLHAILLLMLLGLIGCSTNTWLPRTEGCKIRTHVNLKLEDYLSTRYHSGQPTRLAIMTYDVPESFARGGANSNHFGREIARYVQQEVLSLGMLNIVELYTQESWVGKREDFFSGNYQAIELARNAGYDLVLIGYMDDIRDDDEISIHTKIIDVSNNITVWSSRTQVISRERLIGSLLSRTNMYRERPEIFAFKEQAKKYARCTMDEIRHARVTPQ